MKRMTFIVSTMAALFVMAGILSNGCASKPPQRTEIQIKLLRNDNFLVPPTKQEVTLAALPKVLKRNGAGPTTVILIASPVGTPVATQKVISRVLIAKGLTAPIFTVARKPTSGIAPRTR